MSKPVSEHDSQGSEHDSHGTARPPYSPQDAESAGPSQPLHLRIMTFVFGLMFLASLAMVGHLMWMAEPPARRQLERFFAAIESGRADEVLSLCNPALQEQIDQSVLEAWLEAVRQNLGTLKTVTEEASNKARQAGLPAEDSPAGRLVCGTARFEHGSVYAELHYEDHRLTNLVVQCAPADQPGSAV